jgi:hypothetical protein
VQKDTQVADLVDQMPTEPLREPAAVRAIVVCRDHQAYSPNEALTARARMITAVFADAQIAARVQAHAAALSGREHYHFGAAPWLVEARLRFFEVSWWAAAMEQDAGADASRYAARRLGRLSWGVAAAAGRLRTPVGALTLIDTATGLRLELGFDLHAEQFSTLVRDVLRGHPTSAIAWFEGAWRIDG